MLKGFVLSGYGNIRPYILYRIIQEYRDCYVFANGIHVPKNLVLPANKLESEIKKLERQSERAYDKCSS